MFTVIYILNSVDNDLYADMTLVSMLSLKMFNPSLCVKILTDESTYNRIIKDNHRVLKVADKIISINTPEGSSTFKNRFIKTQLPEFIEHGSYLYLDSDILIRKQIDDPFVDNNDFAAVPNHNKTNIEDQVWYEDLEFIQNMNWPAPAGPYFNGGFFFFRKNDEVINMFNLWHMYWLQGVKNMKRYQDQPALNRAIHESSIKLVVLPDRFNRQVSVLTEDFEDTIVWHYYWSGVRKKIGLRDKNTFTIIVNVAKDLPLFFIKKLIHIAITSKSPRLNKWWFYGIRFINLKNKIKASFSLHNLIF